MARRTISKLGLLLAMLSMGLFVSNTVTLLAAPYGAGGYGTCEYSENCTTDSNAGGANGNTGGTTSKADTSTSGDGQSTQADGAPNTDTNSGIETPEAEGVGSGAHWWQYASLLLLIALVFWWFIIAFKRRKKDEEPNDSSRVE